MTQQNKRTKRTRDAGATDARYPDYDPAEFKRFQDLKEMLVSDYGGRDALLDELEQYWSMIPAEPIPQDSDQTAITVSPDMTNKLMGAWRLLTATEPEFSVPVEQNDPEAVNISSPLERAAKMMWQASGRINGRPLEKDAVLSALHTGQVDIGIVNLLEESEGDDEDNPIAHRVHMARERTPLLFEIWPVREGYALRDRYGLQSYLRRYQVKAGRLKADWPGIDIPFLENKKPTDLIVCNDLNDGHYRMVWVDSDSRPFYVYENKKNMIPVVSQITEGTDLFPAMELKARPFLYTAHKSGLPQRQNLALTALYTLVKALAMTAVFKHTRPQGQDNKPLKIRTLGPITMFDLDFGEDIAAMLARGSIDPALLQALEYADAKTTESTIYSQALGEPLGQNAPFSMVALLHQAGRLPLTSTKILTGWAIASAMELGLHWLKETGKNKIKVSDMGRSIDLNLADIPDDIQFKVNLEIDLPQDMREVASMIPAFKGTVSRRWIREVLLRGVGQSEAMQEEVWSEDMADMLLMQLFQSLQAAEQQAQAQAQAQDQGNEIAPLGQNAPMEQEQTMTRRPIQPAQPYQR